MGEQGLRSEHVGTAADWAGKEQVELGRGPCAVGQASSRCARVWARRREGVETSWVGRKDGLERRLPWPMRGLMVLHLFENKFKSKIEISFKFRLSLGCGFAQVRDKE